MTSASAFAAHLDLIDDRSAALREALAAAADLGAAVPGCPAWTLRDLVAHLGGVQRFWAAAVRSGDPARPPAEALARSGDPVRPPAEALAGSGDLVQWSAESTAVLLAALREAGPGTPTWCWWPESAAPHTAGAVARHQVHEAAVHAFDAQEAIGKPEPLPGAVAVDGVAEFLTVFGGSLGAWPHRPARVVLNATDGPAWTVDLSPTGITLDPPASGAAVVTVHAPAGEVMLALYRRLPWEGLRSEGDSSVLEELREWTRHE